MRFYLNNGQDLGSLENRVLNFSQVIRSFNADNARVYIMTTPEAATYVFKHEDGSRYRLLCPDGTRTHWHAARIRLMPSFQR